MTGIVEMASIHSWKHGLPIVNGDLDDFHDIENNFSESRRRGQEMLDIPTWKRELASKKNKNVLHEIKKTCVFDSSSIPPRTDTKRNEIKSLSEPLDTEHTEEKLNHVDPVKSEVSTNSLSSSSKMGTNTKNSNGRKVQFDKDTVNSVETSHLRRVHSNPFFEKLGVDHPHGNIYNSETCSESAQNDMTNGISSDENGISTDENDIQTEYTPYSGLVGKLRLKFSKLQTQPKKLKAPRRFASLESLVDVGKSKNELKTSYEKVDNRKQSVDKTQKSSDSVRSNVTTPKLRSAPKAPGHHRTRISSADDASKDSVIDSTSDHYISSDFIKGRDDIVIIEQEMQEQTATVKKTNDLPESGNIKVLKDGKATADLPKPNTVINFRTMFEKRGSNTPTSILPDSYNVSKFRSNLPRGKLPPRPSVPPRRKSQEILGTASKGEKEVVLNDKMEQPVNHDISKETLKESTKPTPPQTVKDLSLIFKQKPDRPFESPKTKRRSPEKRAIFDSSVITQVKEDHIIKEEKNISPRSSVSEKPSIHRNKSEQINKLKDTTRISTDRTEEKTFHKSTTDAKPNSKEEKSSSESSSLFPERKQIFDSSNMAQTVSIPVAPPRAKGQKRNMNKKPTTTADENESISLKNSDKVTPSQYSADVKKEENLKNGNGDEDIESSFRTNKMSVQEINERNKQKQLEAEKHLNRISQNDSKKEINQSSNTPEENENDDNETPTRGVPSIIAAKRLNKKDNNLNLGKGIIPLTSASTDDSDEKQDILVKPSLFRSPRSTPPNVPNNDDKKSDAFNFKNVLKSSSKNNQVSGTNIEDLIRGHKKPSAVFDSSNIAVSPKRTTSGVPPLNLSDLVDEKPLDHPYQEGYLPTKIQPCNIVFQGAGVKLKTTPLMKRRNIKGSITFHEDPKYHEYPSEDSALKHYLAENPHEVEDVKKEEEVISLGGSLQDESSDDVDEPTTPRDESIKSNTPLSHSTGELTNYRSKYQTDDFKFGMSFSEPEPEIKVGEIVESVEDEDMDLRPADESDIINYTDSSISDMLF